ncbi:MAG: acyl-CoA thioesterase [Pseudomonadota bacterium]
MDGRLELLRGVVHPPHHDHFGHMNVRFYGHFFDDAAYHMWTLLGLPYSRMIPEHGVHTVAGRSTTNYIRELTAGDLIVIDGAVTRIGTKSTTFHLRMHHADTNMLQATYDVVEVFFDPKTRRSAAMPPEVRACLEAQLLHNHDAVSSR